MSEDKELKQWKEKLFYQPKNGYDRIVAEQAGEIFAYAEGYKQFLDAARTEREAVKEAIRMAEAEGFVPYTFGMELQPGSKVYVNNRGKALMLAVLGQQPLDHGCVIAGAHIDSPRLDLKQTPMYEDSELAYFKTHYYGGIKKYQWVTIPLELHGTVALKDGSTVDIAIGREPDEPQFVITDLLPHLGKDQMRKTMEEGITGEALNIVIGSMPYAGEGRDRVKLAVLSLLYDEYGITEEDFLSAELAAVPAFPARDIGFDRSMIGAYGQDDRVCAYAELRSLPPSWSWACPSVRPCASSPTRRRSAPTACPACSRRRSRPSWPTSASSRTSRCATALPGAFASRRTSARPLTPASPR